MPRKFDSPQQEAYLNLWRTYDLLKAIEEELFAAGDLSPQQYNALRLLQAAAPGSLPTSVIGAKLISRAPDMTRLLDKLEQRGLIQRERRPENRRVVEVTITSVGTQLLESLAEAVKDCHQSQLGHLTSRELKDLIQLLQRARSPHEDESKLSIADRTVAY